MANFESNKKNENAQLYMAESTFIKSVRVLHFRLSTICYQWFDTNISLSYSAHIIAVADIFDVLARAKVWLLFLYGCVVWRICTGFSYSTTIFAFIINMKYSHLLRLKTFAMALD